MSKCRPPLVRNPALCPIPGVIPHPYATPLRPRRDLGASRPPLQTTSTTHAFFSGPRTTKGRRARSPTTPVLLPRSPRTRSSTPRPSGSTIRRASPSRPPGELHPPHTHLLRRQGIMGVRSFSPDSSSSQIHVFFLGCCMELEMVDALLVVHNLLLQQLLCFTNTLRTWVLISGAWPLGSRDLTRTWVGGWIFLPATAGEIATKGSARVVAYWTFDRAKAY
jgi:hypothetical protein